MLQIKLKKKPKTLGFTTFTHLTFLVIISPPRHTRDLYKAKSVCKQYLLANTSNQIQAFGIHASRKLKKSASCKQTVRMCLHHQRATIITWELKIHFPPACSPSLKQMKQNLFFLSFFFNSTPAVLFLGANYGVIQVHLRVK